VRKGCSRTAPVATAKDGVKGEINAEFTIRPDGSVADVALTGVASRALLSQVKRYLESCRYEPVVDEGKPLSLKSSLKIVFEQGGEK
jgi:hypothetical protein